MTEPTYEYVKGQGWVATIQDKWCVIYKPHNEWLPAVRRGWYSDLKTAESKYITLARDFKCYGWEFKIVPWTEGCGY